LRLNQSRSLFNVNWTSSYGTPEALAELGWFLKGFLKEMGNWVRE
jgi:hypothetical protein